MEIALALIATAALGYWLGRRRGRRRDPIEEAGGFLAGGVPTVLAHRDAEERRIDLEEGALDPDEVDDVLLTWDEGVDDEIEP